MLVVPSSRGRSSLASCLIACVACALPEVSAAPAPADNSKAGAVQSEQQLPAADASVLPESADSSVSSTQADSSTKETAAGSGGSSSGAGSAASAACTADCPHGAACSSGSQCHSGSCMQQQCREPGATHAKCDSAADCMPSLVCHENRCSLELAMSCVDDSECVSGSCFNVCQVARPAGEQCNSDRDCVKPSTCSNGACHFGLQAACTSDRECATGTCGTNPRVCTVLLGGTCIDDRECATGSCSWERKCSMKVGSTVNCNSDADCIAGLTCYKRDPNQDIGYCYDVSRLPTGNKCKADAECPSGSCNREGVCGMPVGKTVNCNSDPDCLPGLYCRLEGSDTGYCDERR